MLRVAAENRREKAATGARGPATEKARWSSPSAETGHPCKTLQIPLTQGGGVLLLPPLWHSARQGTSEPGDAPERPPVLVHLPPPAAARSRRCAGWPAPTVEAGNSIPTPVRSWDPQAADGARAALTQTSGVTHTRGQRGEAPELQASCLLSRSCPHARRTRLSPRNLRFHPSARTDHSLCHPAPPQTPQDPHTCVAISVALTLSTYLIVLAWGSKAFGDGHLLQFFVPQGIPITLGYNVHPFLPPEPLRFLDKAPRTRSPPLRQPRVYARESSFRLSGGAGPSRGLRGRSGRSPAKGHAGRDGCDRTQTECAMPEAALGSVPR